MATVRRCPGSPPAGNRGPRCRSAAAGRRCRRSPGGQAEAAGASLKMVACLVIGATPKKFPDCSLAPRSGGNCLGAHAAACAPTSALRHEPARYDARAKAASGGEVLIEPAAQPVQAQVGVEAVAPDAEVRADPGP